MQPGHKIALCPMPSKVDYFKRATARRVWNWALAEWNKQYTAGHKPNAMALKKQFSAIKGATLTVLILNCPNADGQPWLRGIYLMLRRNPLSICKGMAARL